MTQDHYDRLMFGFTNEDIANAAKEREAGLERLVKLVISSLSDADLARENHAGDTNPQSPETTTQPHEQEEI
jgi:hypothetical protein